MTQPFAIMYGFPPNIERIAKKFPAARGHGVIFAYGDTIYHNGATLTEPLLAHEVCHLRQQADIGGVELWWQLYLASDKFRFEQELEAHMVEYGAVLASGAKRKQRRHARAQIAKRLSGPLYGHVVTRAKAEAFLRTVEEEPVYV